MVDKSGVGSIWNKGGWHWEERNYNDFAKQYLQEAFCKISHTSQAAEAHISIYEVKELKGTASVTIRKQKQIFMFEFEGELYFKAKHLSDERQDMMGRIKMHEFNQEDDEIDTEYTAEKQGKWCDGVRTFLRKEMPKILHTTAMTLTPAMKERDMDDQRLAAAKEAEKQAEAEYKAVDAEKRDKKEAIALQAKQREAEMKAAEAMKAPQQVPKVEKVEGTGSVWNTNSYHWEQKEVGKWAEDTLKGLLAAFEYKWNDAVFSVSEVKSLKGEAAVSIRKGKKIVSYDYSVDLAWRVVMLSMEGQQEVARCEGLYQMPEVSNEEEWDSWEVRVQYTADKDNLQACLDQLIRSMAVKELRAAIKRGFVDELMKK